MGLLKVPAGFCWDSDYCQPVDFLSLCRLRNYLTVTVWLFWFFLKYWNRKTRERRELLSSICTQDLKVIKSTSDFGKQEVIQKRLSSWMHRLHLSLDTQKSRIFFNVFCRKQGWVTILHGNYSKWNYITFGLITSTNQFFWGWTSTWITTILSPMTTPLKNKKWFLK